LFINIYPSTLIHPYFPLFIDQLLTIYPQVNGKIVFELNETKKEESSWDLPEMKERIALVKQRGFSIALDDIGKGAAGIQKIIEFAPQYMKLDRYFAEGLSSSKEKQEMISLFIQYAKNKMGVILEGIEKEEDLEAAKRIEVPVIQGYLLGMPQRLTAENHY
jgi:EAL domain-containing protein (putative c-di-GMP-specific phosphodiesterase class I)